MLVSNYTLANVSCADCVKKIEARVSRLPGIEAVRLNLGLSMLTVLSEGDEFSQSTLFAVLEELNYPVLSLVDNKHASERATPFWPVGLALLLAVPMAIAMLYSFIDGSWMLPGWVQWLLATPVQFWLGWRFYRGAWNSLKQATANMDVLVAMGTSAAYGYSVYLWRVEGTNHLYFEASAVVIALILLGKWLEQRAKHLTSQSIRQLLNLQPKMAQVWQGERLVTRPVDVLIAGDEVQILPGETVSADGDIIAGESDINEAMLTGESLPVHRTVGQAVLAGTLNIDGSVRVKVSKSANDFRAKKIAALVKQAQLQKPAVQQLVDRITAVFVPIVIGIALLAFILQWYFQDLETAMVAGISVLIISCPCALGLATPTAIVAASGVGAKRGILIKDIDQLQAIANINHCVFDKTGTITEGNFKVVSLDVWHTNIVDVHAVVYAIESHNSHPLAQALCKATEPYYHHSLTIDQFTHYSGKGIRARVNAVDYLIGNQSLMSEFDIALSAYTHKINNTHATIVWVAQYHDDAYRVIALYELLDTVKKDAPALFDYLQRSAIDIWLLSGDQQAAADAVGRHLGIEHIKGGLLPDEKLTFIEAIRGTGGKTVMIGDGINDVPALAAADASIAMGNGTDIAIETAGITLMRPELALVAEAIQLAQKTQKKIRQNLFWAFIYNVIGIPLAALGLLNPLFAGAAMAFSSVSVVTSSALLLHWRPHAIANKHLKDISKRQTKKVSYENQ
ncbi:MAG: heavy metal translocating P-type ATPase [Pseudomonadota bacterium]